MIVQRLVLDNWLGYAGRCELQLEPTLYAIIGQHEGDARRSNWAGKTSLIEAMRFAFYGINPADTADGWITNGESAGSVEVTFSNGARIQRSRKRGHSTKVAFHDTDGTLHAGDAAQERIDVVLGYSRSDFDVTCWFGQKQMARLITARPGDRFELISGWFRLGLLQAAEERAAERLRGILEEKEREGREILKASAVLASARERWPDVLTASADSEVVALLEVAAANAEGDAAQWARKRQAAQEVVDRFSTAADRIRERDELADLRARGAAMAAELKELEGAAQASKVAQAAEKQSAVAAKLASNDYAQKRRLASGHFDGCCPVDERDCPVKASINEQVTENARRAAEAKAQYDEAVRVENQRRIEAQQAVERERRAATLTVRLDEMRQKAKALVERTRGFEGLAIDEGARRQALDARDDATRREGDARNAASQYRQEIVVLRKCLARQEAGKQALEVLRGKEARARAALRVFGRQGAQKIISEEALAEIASGANAMLRDAGIDLKVTVSWAREGAGLAKTCSECGAAFVGKAKACGSCKAERGHQLVERLDVKLSDTSGAAEDLAGAALQLSAAAWLRHERGSELCVAFLDEPFGALDEANRRAFAGHLVALLRGASGFQQAFIVAHHPDVLDGLPGRILVTRSATGSAAVVQ